jgi:hypothetical protein
MNSASLNTKFLLLYNKINYKRLFLKRQLYFFIDSTSHGLAALNTSAQAADTRLMHKRLSLEPAWG